MTLKRALKYVASSYLSISYTWQNIKTSFEKNKLKMSVPTWTDKFGLPDGSYFVSNTQDYFKYMIKNMKH